MLENRDFLELFFISYPRKSIRQFRHQIYGDVGGIGDVVNIHGKSVPNGNFRLYDIECLK